MATARVSSAASSLDTPASAAGRSRCRKRTAYCLVLLLVGCAVAWLVVDWITPLPDLMLVRRIEPGMTEHEVVALFGVRPTRDTPAQFNMPRPPQPFVVTPTTDRYWYCDAGIVRVVFDSDGRVKFAHQVGYGPNRMRIKLRRFLDPIGLGWLVF